MLILSNVTEHYLTMMLLQNNRIVVPNGRAILAGTMYPMSMSRGGILSQTSQHGVDLSQLESLAI